MLNTVLEKFESVSLEEISSVSLLKRMDSKFLTNTQTLPELLELLNENYFVVEIGGKRVLPYSTIYFDTPNLAYYTAHHNGKLNRLKFRSREYVGSGVVFNEVKVKRNTGKTSKSRIRRTELAPIFDETFREFAEKKVPVAEELIPQLDVLYNRITLVDKAMTERMTIDIDLRFAKDDKKSSFNTLAIVELKQEKGNRTSPATEALRTLRCKKIGFSKYCIGVATTHTNVKRNNFNEKIRFVEKLCGEMEQSNA